MEKHILKATPCIPLVTFTIYENGTEYVGASEQYPFRRCILYGRSHIY